MKKIHTIKFIISLIIATSLFTGCVSDDDYSIPKIDCNSPQVTANTSITEVKALYKGSVTQVTDDLVIEGYVTSSDETGNIYQTLTIQDKPENPTQGI